MIGVVIASLRIPRADDGHLLRGHRAHACGANCKKALRGTSSHLSAKSS